jgi:maltooligosyltrehalose trehalohydrolase
VLRSKPTAPSCFGSTCRSKPAAGDLPCGGLTLEGNGYFSGTVRGAGAGTRYRYRLDDGPDLYPDPASRFQPEGPHGPSEVIDPRSFAWTDHGWAGRGLERPFLYELHIGTFTPEGTFAAAAGKLPALADVGVSTVEVMPVADFAGRFGWGYDGVNLFAPTRLYGRPDDFRRFVDRAHALGLGVILDVVYNHFGPDGNYLKEFSPAYVTDRYDNEWGEAINFAGPDAGPVREFFVANAGYWIDEFHLDGLRLDATQSITDNSPEHVLVPLARRVREAPRGRAVIIVAENEPQHVKLVRPQGQGGYGLDMLWNDDCHHRARVVLTGHNEAYYGGYHGAAHEFVAAAKWGYLYQGQRYGWQGKRRGTPSFGVRPERFVNFIEHHDQVANSARGERSHLLSSPGTCRAMTALVLLPATPMLFMGQEFAAASPFVYFADHKPDLAKLVSKGRAKFLSQFPSIALPQMQGALADPADPRTFERCKLDWSERERHAAALALHRDLRRLRREDPGLRSRGQGGFDGAVLGPDAFALRFLSGGEDDRLLLVNFGRDLRLESAPEPLLAPPEGMVWDVLWSSEDLRSGGSGAVHPDGEDGWCITGQAAVLLRARPAPS